ncbi:MAG: YicC family protein [Acidobacteriota bacterium]|nr:MAG: YicC family protein [Acidobacteriota bacterium]
MIRSMTGYGRGHASHGEWALDVEVRSVNGRQLEIRFRMPQELYPLETALRERVQGAVARGRVDVLVSWDRGAAPTSRFALNRSTAQAMLEAWRQLQQEWQLPDEPQAGLLLRLPGVVEPTAPDDLELDTLAPLVSAALEAALVEHGQVRAQEGAKLADDLRARVSTLRRLLEQIHERARTSPQRIAEAMRERVRPLLDDLPIDEQRLAQEIALAAQKSDATEEIVRLAAHLERMATLLEPSSSGIGRRVEFIVQELRREITTTGAKTVDADADAWVLAFKSELEKIREQASNIE